MNKTIKKQAIFLYVLVFGVLSVCCAGSVFGEDYDSFFIDELRMIKNDLQTLKVRALTRVSITDPAIADIIEYNEDELLILARKAGTTTLFLWEEGGKRSVRVYVVDDDLEYVLERVKERLEIVKIFDVSLIINETANKIVLDGSIPEDKKDRFDEIIDEYSDFVIVSAEEKKQDQSVQLDMQVTELNETLTKTLGVDWTLDSVSYTEALPSFDGSVGDYLKIGDFSRSSGAIVATVNMLIEEGKARVLSKPRLVVMSGESASFLVGGEIPIKTVSTSEGDIVQESVSFKSYGIGMTITPTVVKGKVDIIFNSEISAVDLTTIGAVSDDVAFTTKTVSTHVMLNDGETTVIAGLIKKDEANNVSRVPFLSTVPVLGALFRSRTMPLKENEVVISLTPKILGGKRDVYSENKRKQDQRKGSSKRGSSERSSLPPAMKDYVKQVQQQILGSVVYPKEAQEYGWEGTVKVGMLILNDGTLAFAMVKESAGRAILDDYALRTVKDAAPFTAFPEKTDLKELEVNIPIVYSLQRSGTF